MLTKRGSGILLHLSSLPGRFGIGGLGREAFDFVDFLAEAGQSYWQFLPYGPVSRVFDNSPYMSLSAFAGNPLFIDPEWLVQAGYLEAGLTASHPGFSEYLVEFDRVVPFKKFLLEEAFRSFGGQERDPAFHAFCENTPWLDDYALFMSLREKYKNLPWYQWPAALVRREEKEIARCRKQFAGRILFHKFVQFCFYAQWHELWQYARKKGVSLVGDIPIYVALDSVDVWANQAYFTLDQKTHTPTSVAGVPPDYFSVTGQRWGNPLFAWQSKDPVVRKGLYDWWASRFEYIFRMVDIVRIDHFRGFEAYWEIPAHEKTAVNGKWKKGPGKHFFDEMAKVIGKLPIIAEDLGVITPEVEKLRDDLGYPGMKILQFAFDSDEHNVYLPHNYATTNCVVYTGTHDNDTTVSWFLCDKTSSATKERLRRYANSHPGSPVHWDLIRLAFSSVAAVAIVPMQDVLGFGGDCRMNMPSTSQGNWRWRCAPRFLTHEIAARLRRETVFYNRLCREECVVQKNDDMEQVA